MPRDSLPSSSCGQSTVADWLIREWLLHQPGHDEPRRRNYLEAPQTRHSAKPDAFYDLVERVSPEPRVELFARCARFGWDYWGNQSLGTAELPEAAA